MSHDFYARLLRTITEFGSFKIFASIRIKEKKFRLLQTDVQAYQGTDMNLINLTILIESSQTPNIEPPNPNFNAAINESCDPRLLNKARSDKPSSQLSAIVDIMDRGHQTYQIYGSSRAQLIQQEHLFLLPGQWLYDEVIHAYLCIMIDEEFPEVKLISPTIAALNLECVPNSMLGTVSLGLFNDDKLPDTIVIPINVNNSHWALCVIEVAYNEKIGSIRWFNSSASYDIAVSTKIAYLESILEWEGESLHSPLHDIQWEILKMTVLEQ